MPCRCAGDRHTENIHRSSNSRSSLECFDRLMESPGTRRETADAIVTRSKEAISSMRERASEEDLLDVRSLFNVNRDEVSEHHDPEENPQNVLDDLEMVYERLELSGVIPMCHLVSRRYHPNDLWQCQSQGHNALLHPRS